MKNLTKITNLEQIAAILLSRKISFTYEAEYLDRNILTITESGCTVFSTVTKSFIDGKITFLTADERPVPMDIVLDYLNRLNARNQMTRTEIREEQESDRRVWVKYVIGWPKSYLLK